MIKRKKMDIVKVNVEKYGNIPRKLEKRVLVDII